MHQNNTFPTISRDVAVGTRPPRVLPRHIYLYLLMYSTVPLRPGYADPRRPPRAIQPLAIEGTEGDVTRL